MLCDSLAGPSWASRSMAPGFPLLDLPGRPGQWPLGFTKRSIWAKGGADFEGFVVAKEELIIMEEEVELNNINEYK